MERGVIFDLDHGFGSIDYAVADVAVAEGVVSDVISTDLHNLGAAGPGQGTFRPR